MEQKNLVKIWKNGFDFGKYLPSHYECVLRKA